MGIWCVQGRYQCDPHQQWADEGGGVERVHSCNANCPYFCGCDFEDSVGVCEDQSFNEGKFIDFVFVKRQEEGEGDCVW